jgi:hypothetical protein
VVQKVPTGTATLSYIRRSRGTNKSGALKVWLAERSACSVPFDRNDFLGRQA